MYFKKKKPVTPKNINIICVCFVILFIAAQDAAQPRLTQAIARALNTTLQLATRINLQTTTPQTPEIYINRCAKECYCFLPPEAP